MNHLTMEQLLQLRGPATDPGTADARIHLESCELCQGEMHRLHQRVARLKALPVLQAPRDAWPVVRRRVDGERHRRQARWMGLGGLALAASVILAVILTDVSSVPDLSATIDTAKAQSRELEGAIDRYNPESRVIDGRTARVAADLEDRIAALDRELQEAQMTQDVRREAEVLRLWRERVGLLDALVDVHVTRASNVGL